MTQPETRVRFRRELLRSTGAVALAAFVAGCGEPGEGPVTEEDPQQDDTVTDEDETDDEVPQDEEPDDEAPNDETDDEAEPDDGEGEDDADETEAGVETDEETWDDVDRIFLDAHSDGWNGRLRPFIEGEENPTLELVEGREYDFVYENLDGEQHNLVIAGDGGELEQTALDDEELETHTLTLEATDEITEYYCESHRDAMAGEVEISS